MSEIVAPRYYSRMSATINFDGADTAELLIQIGRLAYAQSGEAGLTPTQWMALRYFERANRFSRTVSAFADYHATTRGTVSQTVKTLTERGFLSRRRSETDGRSVRFDLTQAGRDIIAADPLARLISLIDSLPPDTLQGFAAQVSDIASGLSEAHAERSREGMQVDADGERVPTQLEVVVDATLGRIERVPRPVQRAANSNSLANAVAVLDTET